MLSANSTIANQFTAHFSKISSMTTKNRWRAALLFPIVVGPIWCLAGYGYPTPFGTLTGLVLLATLVTSALTDYNGQRIYNWTTYSAFLWALIINVFASLASHGGWTLVPAFEPANVVGPSFLGGIGIGECLTGAGACFLITMFGYDLSGGGAGDVKLAAVIGALLGLHDGVFAVAYSYIVAAIAIIAWSTWKNGPLALVKAGIRALGRALGPYWPFPSTSEDKSLLMTPVPLGPYFAIGTLIAVLRIIPT